KTSQSAPTTRWNHQSSDGSSGPDGAVAGGVRKRLVATPRYLALRTTRQSDDVAAATSSNPRQPSVRKSAAAQFRYGLSFAAREKSMPEALGAASGEW